MTSLKYRPDIDGLRAIAVLAVVCFHAFPKMLPGGFCGVDVFFVISGYLISLIIFRSLNAGLFTYREFYVRRVLRLFPSLITMLLFCLIAGYVILLPVEFQELGKNAAAGVLFIQNIILSWESGYFAPTANLVPLMHLWSLAVEEQFYIIFPPLLVLVWKRKWPMAWLLTGLFVSSLTLNILSLWHPGSGDFFLMQYRVWEFVGGALLAWVHFQGNSGRFFGRGIVPAGCGTLLLTLSFLMLNKEGFPGWKALLPVSGTLLLLDAPAENLLSRALLSNSLAVWFGLISYPLYLFHWPLLSYARIVSGERYVPAALILSVFLAAMTHHLVERRLRRSRNPRTVILLIAAFACTGLLGLLVCLGILPVRNNSPEIRNVSDAIAEKNWRFQDYRPYGLNLKEFVVQVIRGAPYLFHEGGDGLCTLFVGDSFTSQYLPLIAERLSKSNGSDRGVSILFEPAVPPIPKVMNLTTGGDPKLIEKLYQTLDAKKNIDCVVIAANWLFYFSDWGNYTVNGIRLNNEIGKSMALSELNDLIRYIISKGKKVAVVLDHPWDWRMGPDQFIERTFHGPERKIPADFRLDQFLNREKGAFRQNLKSIESVCKTAGANVITPSDYLTLNGDCILEDENGPVRCDPSHLRGSFVRKHVHYLDRLILPLDSP